MAKSERELLLVAALDPLVTVIDVVHTVNKLHAVMVESSPQNQGYELVVA